MENKYISSAHIEKLGHTITEIRERALFNIVCKLDNGLLFDNDLARSKELLNKLFNWFLFDPCTNEDIVFKLIKKILKSETGKTLINHYGNNIIIKELKKIRSYIEPKYFKHVDELMEMSSNFVDVPPLVSDLPLSYRSTDTQTARKTFGSTATTQILYVNKDDSLDQQDGPKTYRIESNRSSNKELNETVLDWLPLVEPDRHVLKSVEQSLSNPPQPVALLHSCEFFVSVLLQDFPAEVFIQRPGIVFNFLNLLEVCFSTRVTNAVLNCLFCLTKGLKLRLSQFLDPSLRSFKLQYFQLSSGTSGSTSSKSSRNSAINNENDKYETCEDTILLKNAQISILKYCYITANKVLRFLCVKPENLNSERSKSNNQTALNLSVTLIEEILSLLSSTINCNIWDITQQNMKQFNELLFSYGQTLDFLRLDSTTCENNLNSRALYLCTVLNCVTLTKSALAISNSNSLPANFKNALSNSLLDVCMARIYPEMHESIQNFVKKFDSDGDTKKYNLVKGICDGMNAAVKILKNHKHQNFHEFLHFTEKSLPSVEFHKNLHLLKIYVEVVSEKLFLLKDDEEMQDKAENITLFFLSHNSVEIKEEMYRLCHSKVIGTVGPKINLGNLGSPIFFILTDKILTEISMFGVTSKNSKIQIYSENILNHIIKSKILVSDSIWNKTIESLITSLPILTCHAHKELLLGRIIVNILDPDTAKDLLFPKITILKSNAALLFSKDDTSRDEAYSRICWLLATQDDAKATLPRLNGLYDKALSNVCRQPKIVDLNKSRMTQHFYQPSSLYQIVDVLKSKNVEPVIRRSAVTQVSVMLEDALLHQVFLDLGGLDVIVKVIKHALIEQDFQDYPDSVIPAIAALKFLALHHGSVRDYLSNEVDVIISILRAMFLYFTEERVKQDASILLFTLLYKDFIIGSPQKGNFSLPHFVYDTLHVPFICGTHWSQSPYTNETICDSIVKDKWCLSSLQIQWNIEVFGFQNLLKLQEISYSDCNIEVPDILRLNQYDFESIKRSSIDYCIKESLDDIQNGASHSNVIESINSLTLYLNLHNLYKTLKKSDMDDILSHPWEKTLVRFLKVLPSSEEDVFLLKAVIKLLKVLATCHKNSERECWISQFLKNPNTCILDLLAIDNTTEEESKILSEELLKLISICACQEQHYLDYCYPLKLKPQKPEDAAMSWRYVVNILSDTLKFSDAQHFYNLAYLDSILSCLVNLTGSLGWSECKPSLTAKEPIPQMIKVLCELLVAFHCGKGQSASVSVMGLSITRHVLLILNHTLAEIQNAKAKGWESLFLEQNIFENLIALWSSRDTVLRAAALQLFNGLVLSARMAVEVVKMKNCGIWDLTFSVINDESEANIVKENAFLLLANLVAHNIPNETCKNGLKKQDSIGYILGLTEEHNFFTNVELILTKLFTMDFTQDTLSTGYSAYTESTFSSSRSSQSSSSSRSDLTDSLRSYVTTPSLVKNIAIFICNLMTLAPTEVTTKLHEQGILKLLLRTLCLPAMSIRNTRELSLYCDLLEMNSYVCSCLSMAASYNISCLGTILHTRDCFNIVISLLNPKIYHANLPQLIYLRNCLWSEIFNLILIIFNLDNKGLESLDIFSGTLSEIGPEPFLETLCESLCSIGSKDLQTSALASLTSLLRVDSGRPTIVNEISPSLSVHDLLDSVKTPRSFLGDEDNDDEENIEPSNINKSPIDSPKESMIKLLEETYFEGYCLKKPSKKVVQSLEVVRCDNINMSGSEICKILLYLYDLEELKSKKDASNAKKKSLVIAALSALLCVSQEAKKHAMNNGLLFNIIKKLREFVVKLSLDSVECLRKVSDKKRVCPILQELDEVVGLATNFMYRNDEAKKEADKYDIADVLHKLWGWFNVQNSYLLDVLRLLCTFTTNCSLACQSLPLTNPVAGSGPKKSPNNLSLLHAIITLIEKEMNQISRTHDLTALELSFDILHNCSTVLECRVLLSKGNLLQSISRLHPALTKRQKPWSTIELIWLNFLQTFTKYPEGQTCIAKITDVFEIVMNLTNSTKAENRILAMSVLRNLAFYQPNRPRLLSSGEFLNILQNKLEFGDKEEKSHVVVIMWTLAANSQKAKLVLKSANLEKKLQDAIKQRKLMGDFNTEEEDIKIMFYVLNILKDR
ncbi:unnamed protein product [Brassicogethes aeneus]|uniref:Rotatin N-terminal domain-containing protein n=1 Tax=Brassicogethes aeneus TaxID=1431903 RepID=A0A9P0B438_BRAAE|nr:unnamed protein product [Brassicogethes aeneus]